MIFLNMQKEEKKGLGGSGVQIFIHRHPHPEFIKNLDIEKSNNVDAKIKRLLKKFPNQVLVYQILNGLCFVFFVCFFNLILDYSINKRILCALIVIILFKNRRNIRNSNYLLFSKCSLREKTSCYGDKYNCTSD